MAVNRPGRGLRRAGMQVAVVGLGLGLGVGGTALYRAQTSDGQRRPTPNARQLTIAPNFPDVAAPSDQAPTPVDGIEPPDAPAALSAFLAAEAANRPAASWPLLDADAHRRWPTLAAWVAARADRPPPLTFQLAGAATTSPDGVDVSVDVTRSPSLDQVQGLVAARSTEVWRVHAEDGRWRVAADLVDARPVLPSDATAPDTVRRWIDRAVACDPVGAAPLQAGATLLGPADVAASPCRRKGTWTVGSPVALDRGGDGQALLAAYGPGAASWARAVPVTGPGGTLWAQVAPLGDTWVVVGVSAGG